MGLPRASAYLIWPPTSVVVARSLCVRIKGIHSRTFANRALSVAGAVRTFMDDAELHEACPNRALPKGQFDGWSAVW